MFVGGVLAADVRGLADVGFAVGDAVFEEGEFVEEAGAFLVRCVGFRREGTDDGDGARPGFMGQEKRRLSVSCRR